MQRSKIAQRIQLVPLAKWVILPTMQVWTGLVAQNFHNSVVMIGNFDGLHLGHQTLLKQAGEYPSPRIVITFDPHPMQVLRPERRLRRLFPVSDLEEQLPRFGIDLLLVLPFTHEFSTIPAGEFLNRYLGQAFSPKHVVAGYDFAFGNGREGNLELLRGWTASRQITLDVLPPLRMGGEIISSRRIRDAITKGDVHGASLLLGRPFYLRGEVISGAGRGKQIGVPTLNQRVANETLPPIGVYATRTTCEGQTFASVTNVGVNPTFESGSQIKVETHLLNQDIDWRGKRIDVHLLERLRDEKKFSSIEDLKKQIQSDILKAKGILGI